MDEGRYGAAPPDGATSPGDAGRRVIEAGTEYFLRPLLPLLRDPTVSEIMVNGPRDVFVERGGRLERTGCRFEDEQALRAAATNIAQYVGKPIDDRSPILDGRLPDGSRVCIVLHPPAAAGTSINIRRFAPRARSPRFLVERGAITPEAMEFLLLAVAAGLNIVVSGGTGSGKTTVACILSTAFGNDERIVVIEDTRELRVDKPHVVQMEARPPDAAGRGEITVRDLFVASLRMRPDRIVVGEVRRGEALDMIQAMTSGHRGSIATLHADSPDQACGRLETMCLLADVGLPLAALRRQVAFAVDLLVQTVRRRDGRRLVTHVSEVEHDDGAGTYRIRDVFALDAGSGAPHLAWTGARPKLAGELVRRGIDAEIELTRAIMNADGES